MRSIIAAIVLMLTATSAMSKDITITLSDDDQKVFMAALDTMLKQGGLANLQVVLKLVQKYQAAKAASDTPPPPATPEKK